MDNSMTQSDAVEKKPGNLEEEFLAGVSAENPPARELLDALAGLYSAGKIEQADGWAELLLDALGRQSKVEESIDVLELQAAARERDASFRAFCGKAALRLFADSGPWAVLVRCAGFEKETSALTCVKRLRTLHRLRPGVLCTDRTWGFGVVKHVEPLYERVTIDFVKKLEHEMSLEYAAGALCLVDESDIRAMKHCRPDQFSALVRSDPAEVVRMAVRSRGPLSVPALQEFLAESGIVPNSEWKSFWAVARKALAADPFIEFPAKRSDPIRLLEKRKDYDAEWFLALERERDVEKIVSMLENLTAQESQVRLDEKSGLAVENRARFAMEGAGEKRPDMAARCLMALERVGIPPDSIDSSRRLRALLAPEGILAAAQEMPARLVRPFLDYLARADRDTTLSSLIKAIREMPTHLLGETMDFLSETGRGAESIAAFRQAAAARTASPDMLFWLSKHQDLLHRESLMTAADLLTQILAAVESLQKGRRLKVEKQLRSLFEQREWLRQCVERMTHDERIDFVVKVRRCPAWSPVDQNSIVARVVLLCPDLRQAFASPEDEEPDASPRGRFTSWRSRREREAHVAKLDQVDIPQNSRDIALARSYGDLRENHAYEAAKEMQGVLMSRRDSLTKQLDEVKAVSFDGFPTDAAGPGTGVTIERPDGTTERYFILGEWDSDSDLGVISYKSALAAAIAGRKAGDSVQVPDQAGAPASRILKVEPLPPEIKAWADGKGP